MTLALVRVIVITSYIVLGIVSSRYSIVWVSYNIALVIYSVGYS